MFSKMSSISDEIAYYKQALTSFAKDFMDNEIVQQILGTLKSLGVSVFENPTSKHVFLGVMVLSACALGHSLTHAYRAWNSQVKIAWDEDHPPRLGETATLKIFFFPAPSPETIGTQFLSKIESKVTHESGQAVVTENTANVFEKAILIQFKLEKAGKYDVAVLFNGHAIANTPFTITVDSDKMDPINTLLSVESPIVTTEGRVYRWDIYPVDAYGNKCSASNDDLMRLNVKIEKLKEKGKTEVDENEMISTFGLSRDNNTDFMIITLNLKPKQPGVYYVSLFHDDELFQVTGPSNEYEVVVLSQDEDLMVMLSALENKQKLVPITFSAIWTQVPVAPIDSNEDIGLPRQRSHITNDWVNRQIQVELSPKFVYFTGKKTVVSFSTTQIMSFRVAPQTKIKVLDQLVHSDGIQEYAITLRDTISGYSAEIWMPATKARIFFALFVKFVADFQEKSQQTFDSKREVLFTKLREIKRPYKTNSYSGLTYLEIKRTDDIESTLKEIENFRYSDWRKPFKVTYENEKSSQSSKDSWVFWVESILHKLFENNSFGMFYSLGNSKLIHPNPNRKSRWTLDHYELAGKLVGKYLFEAAQGEPLPPNDCFKYARFTRSFLAQILSFMPTYKHLYLDSPEVYQGTVKTVLEEDMNAKCLTFTHAYYDVMGNVAGNQDLIPNGNQTKLTNDNKTMYLDELAKLLLRENVKEEIEAFVFGLTLIVPQELLVSFTENELEILLFGYSKWTIHDFKRYASFPPETIPHASRIKEWLLESIRDLDNQDKGLFLQFLTGSSILPPEGISKLNPRIKINLSHVFGQLPVADQASHVLTLSDHTTRSQFATSLLTAIRGQLH